MNTEGCGIALGLLIGLMFFSWLITIGIIWLIALCLSPFGIIFDIRLATAVWLILMLIGTFFGGKK